MYTITKGDTLGKIAKAHGILLGELLAANPQYKSDPNHIRIGDKVNIPGQSGVTESHEEAATDAFTVPYGQLTFDAEGQETPGRYFSRRVQVPGPYSGITIGRGYDMGTRSANEIIADLTAAGLEQATAERFAAGRGYKGQKARNFITQQQLDVIEITPQQQKALFLITYKELEGDVIRISKKVDVVDKYGNVDWDSLNAVIRDIVVDLRYRGDYTGATRERVQPPMVGNDRAGLMQVITDRDYWIKRHGVPRDRFNRRKAYLENLSA